MNQNDAAESARKYECYKIPRWQRQFAKPVGVVGALVGHIMAIKNSSLQEFGVEMLDVQPGDRVLEIAFGPGKALEMIAAKATRGFVAGVEISDVMVRQASRRNRTAISNGRMELRKASVSNLPFEDASFNKICVINSIQFWPDPPQDLLTYRDLQ